jgi:hypothetical protein
MFVNNEYRKEYFKIIKYYKGYNKNGEVHHIIPKSMGGTNYCRNLVKVPFDVHLKLHTLLPYFTNGDNYHRALKAWFLMSNRGEILDYKEYRYLKERYCNIQSKDKKTREKISKSLKKLWEDENYRKKQIESHKNYKMTKEQKKKISKSNIGKKRTGKQKLNYKKACQNRNINHYDNNKKPKYLWHPLSAYYTIYDNNKKPIVTLLTQHLEELRKLNIPTSIMWTIKRGPLYEWNLRKCDISKLKNENKWKYKGWYIMKIRRKDIFEDFTPDKEQADDLEYIQNALK